MLNYSQWVVSTIPKKVCKKYLLQKRPILLNSSKTNSDYSTPLTDLEKKDFSSRLPEKNPIDEKNTRINESIQQVSKTTGQDLTLVYRNIPHHLIWQKFNKIIKTIP